ncbi:MAG TPA: NAD(P)/FAD-dependent oxidoreductase [Pyrinomonadaceae bacterium]|jgi:phytoene dehydrogenase-like protein|nr:NAD(P)/FAD-dependent oxidoreductase [Pyrinomonadaceae bacterium]
MDYEVVVVGGGIGGLTVAALLAQRGVAVCLLERESRVAGCVASFEKFGYTFEPGHGLFTGWEPDGIHQRVFSELPVAAPEVRRWDPAYAVRLPDQSEISIAGDSESFEANLSRTFPECAANAIAFYQKITSVGAALRRNFQRSPDFLSAPKSERIFSLLREGRIGTEILRSGKASTQDHLSGVSLRFQRFIDAQLQALAQGSSAEVPFLRAALALSAFRDDMFALRGGGDALANSLADALKKSGGRIRLNTPVLRLSYSSSGAASGVDLLSGETINASKAVISNLTFWDTYGKLVGLNRTPAEIRKQLNRLRGWGAYLLYLGLDEDAAKSLRSDHVLTLTDWQADQAFSPEANQLVFAAVPSWDSRAPQGKRAITVHAFTEADDWFTFHRDETELETKDQQMLEECWARLHAAMPELGSSIEVIDTATPRSLYDATRRKLGMAGGAVPSPENFWLARPSYETSLPNLFIVSDTVCPDGIAGLTRSALALANKLTGK